MTKLGFPITWYRDLDSVPETSGFTCYIAHEFLDALPVHKFRRNEKGINDFFFDNFLFILIKIKNLFFLLQVIGVKYLLIMKHRKLQTVKKI